MPEQKIDFDVLLETHRLVKEVICLARGLKYVQSRIDQDTVAARNRVDGMSECLKKLVIFLSDQAGMTGLPGPQLDPIREVRPDAVVYDLKWKKMSRASVEVYINGNLSKPVALTRQEWEFLKFLAESRPDPADGLAAARSLAEVVAHLGNGKSRTGDPKKYVNHMVSRIRIALGKQEFSSDLVRRDEQLGVRFAFRGNL